jgi:molybdate transport system substrate-binding protein
MNLPLVGISSMATRQILAELTVAWRARGGDVVFESVGGVAAARRVLDGEPLDVVVLAADAIGRLADADRLVAGSKVDMAVSEVAIAVRSGAPQPAVGTEAELRQAVLSARTIGYSTGPSGEALQELFGRWGITDQVRSRLVQAPPGVPVGALIAAGDAELGFQQKSELLHADGVEVIGTMPPGHEIVTTFSAAICRTCTRIEAARALLDFVCSPAADAAKLRHGMRPA